MARYSPKESYSEPARRNPVPPLILLLVLLGLLYWLLNRANQGVVSPTPSPTVTASPTASPSPVIPVGWNVYRNETYRVQFAYPPNWSITTGGNEGLAVLASYPYAQEGNRAPRGDEVKAVLQARGNPQHLSAAQWFEQSQNTGATVLSRSDILVGGLSSLKVQTRSPQGAITYQVYVPYQDRMVVIDWQNANDDVLNQMLRTVTFYS